MRILLAEDDLSIQMIAKLTLEKVGGHVVTAVVNGHEAYEKAHQESFELIILDGMMPEMDGLECCRLLKQSPTTEKIPVVFLTARNQQSDIEEALRAGAVGYIVKPFDAKKLCQQIETLMRSGVWSTVA